MLFVKDKLLSFWGITWGAIALGSTILRTNRSGANAVIHCDAQGRPPLIATTMLFAVHFLQQHEAACRLLADAYNVHLRFKTLLRGAAA